MKQFRNETIKQIILSAIITISLISCNQTDEQVDKIEEITKKIEELKGKTIIFPDSVLHMYQDSLYHKDSLAFYKGKNIKIVTKIFGDCDVCVESLKKWEEEIMPHIDTSKVAFLFYIYIERLYSFQVGLYNRVTLDYPLIIDTADYYLRANKLEEYDQRFTTFLLDKDNKIVLVGIPTGNKKLTELYIKNINELIGN